jgi:hypothetical protein
MGGKIDKNDSRKSGKSQSSERKKASTNEEVFHKQNRLANLYPGKKIFGNRGEG